MTHPLARQRGLENCLAVILLAASLFQLRGAAQTLGGASLLASYSDPSTLAQSDSSLGAAVALDGDIAVVGAPWADYRGYAAGVVKVYNVRTGALLLTIPNPRPAALIGFGGALAISANRLVLGASGDNSDGLHAGIAYVFDLQSITPATPVLTLTNPMPNSSTQIGGGVAIYDTRVAVAGSATNGGLVHIFDLAAASPTVPVLTLTNPTAVPDNNFAGSIAMSGSRIVVGADSDGTGAPNSGSAYVYDLAGALPSRPLVKLNNPNPANYDKFGSAVGVFGSRVVVGSWSADRGAINAGTVYVFDLNSLTPLVPAVTLINPHPSYYSLFGYAVSISGTRVAVGAYSDTWSGPTAGVVHVFDLAKASPGVVARTLLNPTPYGSDYFGEAVAISGTHVVVGAYGDNSLARGAGNVYFYDLNSPTPSTPAATPSDFLPSAGDGFGHAVGISGTRIAIGALGDSTGAISAGRVYVYDLASPTPFVPWAALNNPAPGYQDAFGWSVAISSNRVVAGALYDAPGSIILGAAYVFDLAGPNPLVPKYSLSNPITSISSHFGIAVAIEGARVAVGSERYDAGNAYVYDLSRSTPTVPLVSITNPKTNAFRGFGMTVAIANPWVAVGAPTDTADAMGGRAFLYDLTSDTPAVPAYTLAKLRPAANDRFGASVALSSQFAVVGVPLDDTGATNSGAVVIFDLTAELLALPFLTLTNPRPIAGAQFGASVAISGTRVVVGTPSGYTGDVNTGAAFVFDVAGTTPTVPIATLSEPNPGHQDYFGYAVAIDGLNAIVGAYGTDGGSYDRGTAHLFGVGPKLSVARTLPRLASISWAPPVPGYVLQYNSGFGSADWLNAPSGGTNPTTVPIGAGSRIYRLSRP